MGYRIARFSDPLLTDNGMQIDSISNGIAAMTGNRQKGPDGTARPDSKEDGKTSPGSAGQAKEALNDPYSKESREVKRLQARDREVRAHEMAHIAAGGQYVRGGASFQYQRGPDGTLYAVGGEVSIDAGAVPSDPDATLKKADVIRRAALAPADPSSQDRRVAAEAGRMAAEARMEIQSQGGQQGQEPATGGEDSGTRLQERISQGGALARDAPTINLDLFV